MYYILYKTTNKVNGKFYVGKHITDCIEDGYLGSGLILGRAIKKYGIDNFYRESINLLSNEKELDQAEKEFLSEDVLNDPKCYNLNGGGEGSWTYVNSHGFNGWAKPSNWKKTLPLRIRKLKQRHKEGKVRYDTFTGKHHSAESKRRMGEKNSIHQTGSGNSRYNTCWVYSEGLHISKSIPKDELENWMADGWIKGRKIKW